MQEFVLCEHPDLPGQTAWMSHPRNGWEPVALVTIEDDPDSDSPDDDEPDDPDAGESTPTENNTQEH